MSLSPVAYFGSLDPTNPQGTDSRTISDDQHRNILQSNRDQCPNWTGEVTATHGEVNYLSGYEAAGVKPMPGTPGASGTVLYAYNASTPPIQWTLEEPDANIRELVVGPSASGGTIGGSMDPTDMTQSVTINFPANTGGHSLTVAELAAHTHDYVKTNLNNDRAFGSSPNATGTEATVASSSTGSGDAHSHTIGGSDSDTVEITPRYARGILMKFTG